MIGYPIIIEQDGDGYLVTCPDLPEVTTDADRVSEAGARAKDAIEEALAGRLQAFEDIPRPSSAGFGPSAGPSLSLALKVELFWSLRDAGKTRADLMRDLGWSRTSVDRLFDPNHASRIDQIEAAFLALHKRAEVIVEAA